MKQLVIKYIFVPAIFIFGIIASISAQDEKIEDTDKFEINDINIKFAEGQSFEADQIKNLLASKEDDHFLFETFLTDIERIKKFYFDNGFFDARVDTQIVYKRKDKEVDESFIIYENLRYTYKDIVYKGLDSLDSSLRNKIFTGSDEMIRAGNYYSKDTIKLEVQRILNILNNNGYATADNDAPEVLKYETNDPSLVGKANVILKFYPKLKYVFGPTSITFKNNKYNITQNDIRRELTYSENQIYNKEEVVNSEINLGKISLIENPRITIDTIDSVNKKVYLAINAIISNKYELTPEIFGYYLQNIFYMGAGISYIDKYFLGGGRYLTSSLRFYFHSFNDNKLQFVNRIVQPFLFNNRNISGNWDLGIQYSLNEEYNLTQVENTFGVSYDLPSYTYINKISTSWELQNNRFSVKKDIKVDTLVLGKFTINYFTSILSLALIHNSVNNIQFPSAGYYQSYEIEESGLLGGIVSNWFNTATISYIKFTNFNSYYFNLNRKKIKTKSVLAGKFLAGIVVGYGDNQFEFQGNVIDDELVPTDEKFVCGGSASVRGWAARQLGIVPNKYNGGNFIVETSIENRLRPFLDAENVYIRDLGFATFIDIGNVWTKIGKFKLNELAFAAGGGFRYYTIIGAIRLDLGFKIYDPQPGTEGGSNWIFGTGCNFSDKYNFQFGIGNTF